MYLINKAEIPEGTIEDYQRSNHNDFATSKELKDREFSGVRHNSLTDRMELWVFGRVEIDAMKSEFQDRYEEWLLGEGGVGIC